jgi:ribonuclease HI
MWSENDGRRRFTKVTTTYRKMELATQQILKKNILQHEVLKVELYDSKFPPFIQTSSIIPPDNSKEEQKKKVQTLLQSNHYDYIISTDGSTLKEESRSSLGPSGAAAIVFAKENMRDPLDVATTNLGPLSHNYEAELAGLQLALQLLQHKGVNHKYVLVVSDCIPAMESTFTNKITVDYNHTIMSNKNILYNLQTIHHNKIDAVWAPGHEGIQINEMADIIAKKEAAKQNNIQRPLERKIVLTNLKQQVLTNWQRRVDHELTNHQITEVNNTVKSWKIHNVNGSKHLVRLATGHHFLNSFQSKINSRTLRNCSCGQAETMHHYLFLCQKYVRFRQKWQHRVAGITEDLDVLNDPMSLTTAFGQRIDLSDEKNRELQESTCKYILDTNRF